MKFTNNISKLGPDVVAVNRPIGLTCPIICRFSPAHPGSLRNKCYMVRQEGRFPNVRKAARDNMEADQDELIQMMWDAHWTDKVIRLHVGGDFVGPDGELDRAYINAWVGALERFQGCPEILCYTHVIDKPELVAAFAPFHPQALGFHPDFILFASVHDQAEIEVAQRSGFTRFALALDEKHYEWGGGAWVERFGIRALVCPEQRSKIADCGSCRYCWKEWKRGGHVAFVEHSQPNRRGKETDGK